MRPGTPGFIGARLIEAREARCMAQIALADLVGISRQSISLYEKGKQTPGPEVLQKISERLAVPITFFMKPPPPPVAAPTFFRSMSAATKAIRLRAKRLLGWLREIALDADSLVELPPVNLPSLSFPSEPAKITYQEIERAAQETRRFWGMGDGPIVNVAWLLESQGVLVGRVEIDDAKLDGLSQWCDERPVVLLNADKNCCVRGRVDSTHELGHLILHRGVDESRMEKKSDFALIEKQAFAFGGALLLPARVFAPLAYSASLDGFLALKEKWRVSVKAMIMRAAALKVISSDQQRRLFVAYSRRGWHANEPLDDELPVERPRMLDRVFELLTTEGGMSKDGLLDSLCLPSSDVERLAGLPKGYFSGATPTVTEFVPRLREHRDDRRESAESTGTILPFPPRRSN